MKSFKLMAATTALLATSLACAVPAAAEMRSQTVKFADLDVSTPAGATALYSRLKVTAWRLCRDSDSPLDRFEVTSCMREAIDGAVKAVNRPNLTALHEGRAAGGLTAKR